MHLIIHHTEARKKISFPETQRKEREEGERIEKAGLSVMSNYLRKTA